MGQDSALGGCTGIPVWGLATGGGVKDWSKGLTLWHDRWSEGRIGFHRDSVNAHLQAHADALLAGTQRVLVPLCGKSVDMPWLVQQGVEVVGVELVPRAVEQFCQDQKEPLTRVDRAGLPAWTDGLLTILQGDILAVGTEHTGTVDAIYDRAALIAMPPDDQQRYADHLFELLAPGGRMLLLTYDMPLPATQGPPFSVHPDRVPELFSSFSDITELSTTMLNPQTEPKLAKRGVSWAREVVWLLRKEARA